MEFDRFANALTTADDSDLLDVWEKLQQGNRWPSGAQFSQEIHRAARLRAEQIERARSAEIIAEIRANLNLQRTTE